MQIFGERNMGACKTCHLVSCICLFHATRSSNLVVRLKEYVTVKETDDDNASSSYI